MYYLEKSKSPKNSGPSQLNRNLKTFSRVFCDRDAFFTRQSMSPLGNVPIEILPGKRHIAWVWLCCFSQQIFKWNPWLLMLFQMILDLLTFHQLKSLFQISFLVRSRRRYKNHIPAVLRGLRFHRSVKKVEWYLFNIRKSD